jgi:hypothetical protein
MYATFSRVPWPHLVAEPQNFGPDFFVLGAGRSRANVGGRNVTHPDTTSAAECHTASNAAATASSLSYTSTEGTDGSGGRAATATPPLKSGAVLVLPPALPPAWSPPTSPSTRITSGLGDVPLGAGGVPEERAAGGRGGEGWGATPVDDGAAWTLPPHRPPHRDRSLVDRALGSASTGSGCKRNEQGPWTQCRGTAGVG